MDLSKRDQKSKIVHDLPHPGQTFPSEISEDEECPVCLDPILPTSTIGTIKSCEHYYHESCISTWSSHSNSCPTCRRLYRKVEVSVKNRPNHKLKIVTVQDRIPANDAIESIPAEYVQSASSSAVAASSFPPIFADAEPNAASSSTPADYAGSVCTICTSSQYRPTWKMMTCTQCLSSFHSRCLGIRASIDIWYCPMCDSEQVAPPMVPIASAGTSIRSLTSNVGDSRRRRATPSLNSRITEAVFRNPASSSLYIGSTATAASSSGYVRPATASRRRPTGLVIFNNNNELDDDFDSVDDEPRMEETPTSSVFNGGVLRRRELRQKELLSQEESQSWDSFERAKEITSTEVIAQGPEPELTPSGSNSLEVKGEEVPKRRRRRKITRKPEEELINETDTHKTASNSGNSRITQLINQMKSSTHPRALSSSHLHPNLSTNSSIASSAQDSSDGSPHSLSPEFIMVDSDSSCPSEEDLATKRVCRSDAVSSSTGPLLPVTPEISLDEKNLIQFHIRNHLRPMYKPDSPASDCLITKESDYIEVNKNLSRQIYKQILALPKKETIFQDPNALRNLIDDALFKWKAEFRGTVAGS
ncbi:hypothetical protein CLIB1423_15S02850 [[Candida] railenensis]|uniref:RING-type domain-containing protein n=1 Tax=[Candida] railenensis TaxID=45579 RepID=A0A9P0QRQ7_9ASCO|nr:hypothetical protein CLIB1423_15S02850 [[Candida] railenensis]